jgi:hypothetical protein
MRSDCGKLAGCTRLIAGKEPMYLVWRLAQYLLHSYVASQSHVNIHARLLFSSRQGDSEFEKSI